MPSPSEAIIKKPSCPRSGYPKFSVFFQPSLNTGNVHIPLSNLFGMKKRSQLVELLQISLMNHRGHRDSDAGFLEIIDRLNDHFKRALAPEGLMAFFHPVKADLNFVDTKSFGYLFGDPCAIGEEDGSKCVILQDVVNLPEMRVEQRFPTGKEESKSLHFLKFS
jgi:hypothetical protein